MTPLHLSSLEGHFGVCQFLLEKGAVVNAKNNEYDILPYAYAYDHVPMGIVLFATFLFWNFQWTHPAAYLFC
jgi:hypothetical protein